MKKKIRKWSVIRMKETGEIYIVMRYYDTDDYKALLFDPNESLGSFEVKPVKLKSLEGLKDGIPEDEYTVLNY